jgi:hypothetical protein
MRGTTRNENGDNSKKFTDWSRRSNLLLTVAWFAVIPIAYFAGWYWSLAFISACSIYANFTGHLAAWRSDANPNQAQLDRIEAMLNELVGNNSSE